MFWLPGLLAGLVREEVAADTSDAEHDEEQLCIGVQRERGTS